MKLQESQALQTYQSKHCSHRLPNYSNEGSETGVDACQKNPFLPSEGKLDKLEVTEAYMQTGHM